METTPLPVAADRPENSRRLRLDATVIAKIVMAVNRKPPAQRIVRSMQLLNRKDANAWLAAELVAGGLNLVDVPELERQHANLVDAARRAVNGISLLTGKVPKKDSVDS